MLGTHNVAVDPITGLPKAEQDRQRKQVLESKLNKAETIAHLLSQELVDEKGRFLIETIFEQMVNRLGYLMAHDIELQTLLGLLDKLNVKLNILPHIVREEMGQRLPYSMRG
jgi:hypothetical protein